MLCVPGVLETIDWRTEPLIFFKGQKTNYSWLQCGEQQELHKVKDLQTIKIHAAERDISPFLPHIFLPCQNVVPTAQYRPDSQ